MFNRFKTIRLVPVAGPVGWCDDGESIFLGKAFPDFPVALEVAETPMQEAYDWSRSVTRGNVEKEVAGFLATEKEILAGKPPLFHFRPFRAQHVRLTVITIWSDLSLMPTGVSH